MCEEGPRKETKEQFRERIDEIASQRIESPSTIYLNDAAEAVYKQAISDVLDVIHWSDAIYASEAADEIAWWAHGLGVLDP